MPAYLSTDASQPSIPLTTVRVAESESWLSEQNRYLQGVARSQNFGKHSGAFFCNYSQEGQLQQVVLTVADDLDPFVIGKAIRQLPKAYYHIDNPDQSVQEMMILAWGFATYDFDRYRKANQKLATLVIDDSDRFRSQLSQVRATVKVRDLINTPADDMGPTELTVEVQDMAEMYGARFRKIVGDDLLTENFPSIHIVGRASHKAPRLLEMEWGNSNDPQLILVGKGVCFDTGGNNMKPAQFMKTMKKDMGGAAHVIGLAQMIMDHQLPVHLRVLIPTVENAVAGNAYRQGDIVTTRSGKSVEIGHTDAEGRVILADALTYAGEHEPAMIIDFATLTGAARVALGPDVPPLFCSDDKLSAEILASGESVHDLLWPMPLYQPYLKYIKPQLADLNNSASIPQGGCITAALFLQQFVPADIPWVHIDTFGWSYGSRTGGIEGGEALGMRAVFDWIKNNY
ncbi:leucyl aminopeptidase family protein [Marinicella sp. W31]|uniref:leucyl aminopeptidase family protein n=1 Tax=Marinicella sp. W31 TaxID=3023713 RepID=UPI003756A4D6